MKRIYGSKNILAAFFITVLLFPPCTQAAHVGSFSNIIVFGDSLSDNGNVSAALGGAFQPIPHGGLIPSAPYAGGRFSNGPVWSELLASSLGNTLFPSLTGGTNFAFGNARTGNSGALPPTSPTLVDQLAMFSASTGGIAPEDALYVVWGGANDVRDAAQLKLAGNNNDALTTVDQAVSNIAFITEELAGLGAVDILVGNMPDLGLTPEAFSGGSGMMQVSTELSNRFNSSLRPALDNVRASTGVNLIEMDIFGLFSSVADSPASFGFSSVSAPCVDLAAVCSNPNDYLFYDGIHPTTAGHQVIANFALSSAIPEPAPYSLVLTALVLLRIFRKPSKVFYRRPRLFAAEQRATAA